MIINMTSIIIKSSSLHMLADLPTNTTGDNSSTDNQIRVGLINITNAHTHTY